MRRIAYKHRLPVDHAIKRIPLPNRKTLHHISILNDGSPRRMEALLYRAEGICNRSWRVPVICVALMLGSGVKDGYIHDLVV